MPEIVAYSEEHKQDVLELCQKNDVVFRQSKKSFVFIEENVVIGYCNIEDITIIEPIVIKDNTITKTKLCLDALKATIKSTTNKVVLVHSKKHNKTHLTIKKLLTKLKLKFNVYNDIDIIEVL